MSLNAPLSNSSTNSETGLGERRWLADSVANPTRFKDFRSKSSGRQSSSVTSRTDGRLGSGPCTLRSGVNENDNSETEKLLSFLIKLRHLGYAVLVIHHTNKAGEQRGASIIEVPMDYVIRLAHPDKGEAAFKKGACFNVQFTKVRNKEPQNRDFTCELLETPGGILDFAVNTSLTEVPHTFVVLRALAECEVRPSIRLLSNRIGFAIGKISKLITVLKKEGALV